MNEFDDNFFVDSAGATFGVEQQRITLSTKSGSNLPAAQPLPRILSAANMIVDHTLTLPPELIKGVLHQGLKGVLASSSKAGKTWLLLGMALSVASGLPWMKWQTVRGKVLVINFEIPNPFLRERLLLLKSRQTGADLGNLDIWTLRGHSAPFSALFPRMAPQIESAGYALIIIDPIYKGLAGSDENKASDIAQLCNDIEGLCERTGAAIVYAHHFSKGSQANRNVLDRMSGSGVFTRDADTIITMTQHEVENCYTIDLILRNLPSPQSFVAEWDFPIMKVRPDLDVSALEGRGGRPAAGDMSEELLALIKKEPMTNTVWEKKAQSDLGMNPSTFKRYIKRFKEEDVICHGEGTNKYQVSKRSQVVPKPTEE